MTESVKKYWKAWAILLIVAFSIAGIFRYVKDEPLLELFDIFGRVFLAGVGIIYVIFRKRGI